jgi:hypothetical protein
VQESSICYFNKISIYGHLKLLWAETTFKGWKRVRMHLIGMLLSSYNNFGQEKTSKRKKRFPDKRS